MLPPLAVTLPNSDVISAVYRFLATSEDPVTSRVRFLWHIYKGTDFAAPILKFADLIGRIHQIASKHKYAISYTDIRDSAVEDPTSPSFRAPLTIMIECNPTRTFIIYYDRSSHRLEKGTDDFYPLRLKYLYQLKDGKRIDYSGSWRIESFFYDLDRT